MNLSKNFTLQELTKSDTAVRKGIDNNPNSDQIAKLQLLCENILQPVRDHFGPVVVTSGYRSPQLSVAIGSSINVTNVHVASPNRIVPNNPINIVLVFRVI